MNEKETTATGVNWTVNFGDSQQISGSNFNISTNLMLFVQNNYSAGGDYALNASVVSPGTSDAQPFTTKFGLHASALTPLLGSLTLRTLELKLYDDLTEPVRNATWNCSENLSPMMLVNFTGTLWDYLQHNYTTPGVKTFECNATSVDGSDRISTEFTIDGLEVENYDILTTNASRHVVAFDVENPYYALETNVSVKVDNTEFSRKANISTDASLMVFTEVNYTSDGTKLYLINLSSTSSNSTYVGTSTTLGAVIENYARVESATKNIFLFDVRNNWLTGAVTWEMSLPAIKNITTINQSSRLMVFVEDNSSVAGNNTALINATVSSYVDKITDIFQIKPLEIKSYQLNSTSGLSATFAFTVHNNLASQQNFTWRIDTGIANRTSTYISLNNNTNQTFILAENYSVSNVYSTRLFVNSSLYHDNRSEVVII